MNQELYASAYEKGFRATVRFIRCKGASAEEAEEVAQGAWARGWEAREQLKSEDCVIPWVNSIAYRRFCNDRRRSSRSVALKDVTDAAAAPKTEPVDAKNLLSKCSGVDRSLLEARYFGDLSMNEIGRRHGMSAGAVRVRIHRCQSNLRSITSVPRHITASSQRAQDRGNDVRAA
jgi:RNA polymerase sigma factor (sigma-70 family)